MGIYKKKIGAKCTRAAAYIRYTFAFYMLIKNTQKFAYI